MLIRSIILYAICLFQLAVYSQYYPPNGKEWETKEPDELGVAENFLQSAIDFAKSNEYSGPKDLRVAILEGFSSEPFHEILGPTKKRGGPAGMILKNGYLIAQWGDIDRVDMTFSVTKSYLSTLAGLAVDEGLIESTGDLVQDYVWDGTFDGEHNQKITWDHLLTQSSNWSGELFGIRDWADRPPRDGGIDDWKFRTLETPGTVFEYNDVRVNVLAYSLAQVWRKPLPQVLKNNVMDKIGASSTWRWYGYEHSWITIDGAMIQSVSGGGHSGGGLFINTRDHARFGLLFSRNGKWKDQQIISESWIKNAKSPSEANSSYGYMWWLNQGNRKWENIEDTSIYYAAGFGGNFIIVDNTNDMVIVTRWLEPSKLGEFMALIHESI